MNRFWIHTQWVIINDYLKLKCVYTSTFIKKKKIDKNTMKTDKRWSNIVLDGKQINKF